jgi:hypothetical protein
VPDVRRIRHVVRLEALVGERDRLRQCVTRQHRLRERQCRDAADQRRRRALEELPPVDAAVAVLVVEVEHDRIDLRLG